MFLSEGCAVLNITLNDKSLPHVDCLHGCNEWEEHLPWKPRSWDIGRRITIKIVLLIEIYQSKSDSDPHL